MFNRQFSKSQKEIPAQTDDTIDLTADELRAIAGGKGVSLNIEFERDGHRKGHSPHHGSHEGKN
jgi:hypothetical protein